jgi:hypothetical protein
MRYIAIDPGSKFTGIAVLEEDGTFSFHGEYAEPIAAWFIIESESEDDLVNTTIILEDLIGGGQRDEHITRTIKIVGYFEFHCAESGYRMILVPNQARLANVKNVPSDITGKDEIAAAAHALSARERKL